MGIPGQLEKITVKGFKSIREQTVELRPINVLIGANGAGKSNFVGVFRLLNAMIDRRLQSYTAQVGAASLLHFGPKVTESIEVALSFFTESDTIAHKYRAVLVPSDQDTLIFENETASNPDHAKGYSTENWFGTALGESWVVESVELLPDWTFGHDLVAMLKDARVYHFHDTSRASPMKQAHSLYDNEALRFDAGNLAAYLYLLQDRHPAVFEQVEATLRLIAPFFDRFNLRPNPLNDEIIRLEWREIGSDAYFNAHSLSDGMLRFIALTTLLQQPAELLPKVIIIDEPELGLHPYAITLLADMVRAASVTSQVILSTQSVTLINQFEADDLVIVERENGESTFRRPSAQALASWLDDYALGELWEKNVLGGRPGR